MTLREKSRLHSFATDEQRIALLYDSVFSRNRLRIRAFLTHDTTDYCAWEHINFSRMGHARALYDFFETPTTKRKQDDAVSEDFGFPARRIERPEDDRNRLNKQLFQPSLTSRLTYDETRMPWPEPFYHACTRDVLSSSSIYWHSSEPLIGPEEATTWQALLERLTSGRQLLISRLFLASGVAPGYTLRLGDGLLSGRSELTRPRIASQ